MTEVQTNVSLKKLNTFGIEVCADRLVEVHTPEQLSEVLSCKSELDPLMVIGGGSNLLFTKDFGGTVLLIRNKGIEIISENEDVVTLRVAAGENWHEFVCWCLDRGYGGLENLSLIPGNVGSSPIQNIGAYGVEVKDCIYSVEAIEIATGQTIHLDRASCKFGYRDSIFKRELKNQVILWSVTFKLSRHPQLLLEYGSVSQELEKMGIQNPGIREVSEAICSIRRSKLPDPEVIGNAGSFFKNPTVPAEQAELLRASYPGLVSYYLTDGQVKLAAGWLIEQCRWKGFREGDAGVHPQQALVLVNYGNAGGQEILSLAERIQQSVLDRFDVLLEMEVNII